jgi:hypothetical protein
VAAAIVVPADFTCVLERAAKEAIDESGLSYARGADQGGCLALREEVVELFYSVTGGGADGKDGHAGSVGEAIEDLVKIEVECGCEVGFV